MARITVEDCLVRIGNENRFSLVHLTVERIRQHRHGEPMLVSGRKNKEVVMTLREIAAGEVTMENVQELPQLRRAAAIVAEEVEAEDSQEQAD